MKKNIINKQAINRIPGYTVLNLWVLFTALLVGWIILASLSTTREIFSSTMLQTGLHFENYVKALFTHNVASYFLNSVI